MTESQRVAYRLRKRLFMLGDKYEDRCLDYMPLRGWWVSDDLPYIVNEWVQRACCLALGHVFIGDQCGAPEHDFCAYCRKTTPGAATRQSALYGVTE